MNYLQNALCHNSLSVYELAWGRLQSLSVYTGPQLRISWVSKVELKNTDIEPQFEPINVDMDEYFTRLNRIMNSKQHGNKCLVWTVNYNKQNKSPYTIYKYWEANRSLGKQRSFFCEYIGEEPSCYKQVRLHIHITPHFLHATARYPSSLHVSLPTWNDVTWAFYPWLFIEMLVWMTY